MSKTITQYVLGGKVIQRFTVLETFECDELKTIYVKGGVYNIREGNDALIERVNLWIEQKKVRL